MALPVVNFQPETFDQANPFLAGVGAGNNLMQQYQDIYKNNVLNQFLGPNQQQALQQAIYNNQVLAPRAQMASQFTQAQLQQAQALPGLTAGQTNQANAVANAQNANARFTGAQTNLFNQQIPYKVQQAEGQVITDPIQARQLQLQFLAKDNPAAYQQMVNSGLAPPLNATGQPNFQSAQSGRAQQGGVAQQGQPQVQGGMPQQQQNGGPQPISNNVPTPASSTPNLYQGQNAAQNYAIYGNPYGLQMGAIQKQLGLNVSEYNDTLNSANTLSDQATSTDAFLNQFKNNYDSSKFKGPLLGHTPTTFSPASEQATDKAAANIQLQYAKLLNLGKITNYELGAIGNAKPARTDAPQTANSLYNFMQAKDARLHEEPNFYTAAQNMQVPPQIAKTLLNQYNSQRPVYDFANNKKFGFNNTWQDYLTPQAINAAKSGQNYVPIPDFSSQSKAEFQNWFKTLNPGDRQTVKMQLAAIKSQSGGGQ